MGQRATGVDNDTHAVVGVTLNAGANVVCTVRAGVGFVFALSPRRRLVTRTAVIEEVTTGANGVVRGYSRCTNRAPALIDRPPSAGVNSLQPSLAFARMKNTYIERETRTSTIVETVFSRC